VVGKPRSSHRPRNLSAKCPEPVVPCDAQDLTPRAYFTARVRPNAVIIDVLTFWYGGEGGIRSIECGALYHPVWLCSDARNKTLIGISVSGRSYRSVLEANSRGRCSKWFKDVAPFQHSYTPIFFLSSLVMRPNLLLKQSIEILSHEGGFLKGCLAKSRGSTPDAANCKGILSLSRARVLIQ
jgi:hypothetical protein